MNPVIPIVKVIPIQMGEDLIPHDPNRMVEFGRIHEVSMLRNNASDDSQLICIHGPCERGTVAMLTSLGVLRHIVKTLDSTL